MQEYRISREDMLRWCTIPKEELANHPESKVAFDMQPDREHVNRVVADLMCEELIRNNEAGLPTKWVLGSGPAAHYPAFIERVNRECISLRDLWVFQMDECLDWEGRPYPLEVHPMSCEGRMRHQFYDKIDPELNVPEEQRIFPRLEDLDRPDRLCEELGGIDTVWAGVGYKGLVANNETPIDPYQRVTLEQYARSRTRVVYVTPDNIIQYSERDFGGCYDLCNPMMLTLGMKTMLSAKRAVYIIATGSWKHTVLRVAMFAEPTLEYPVTLFPAYVPDVRLVCDEFTADHPLSHATWEVR